MWNANGSLKAANSMEREQRVSWGRPGLRPVDTLGPAGGAQSTNHGLLYSRDCHRSNSDELIVKKLCWLRDMFSPLSSPGDFAGPPHRQFQRCSTTLATRAGPECVVTLVTPSSPFGLRHAPLVHCLVLITSSTTSAQVLARSTRRPSALESCGTAAQSFDFTSAHDLCSLSQLVLLNVVCTAVALSPTAFSPGGHSEALRARSSQTNRQGHCSCLHVLLETH